MIIPIVLGVVLLILVALLRALVAPLLMMGTVVLSFLASLGACALASAGPLLPVAELSTIGRRSP